MNSQNGLQYDPLLMKQSLTALLVFTLFLPLLSHCGKRGLTVGGGDPEAELKKCAAFSEDKKYEEAIECLKIFKSKFPQTEYGTRAELYIADNHFNKKEYLEAADTYKMYLRLHPGSSEADYAYYRLGLSYLKESPKAIDRDQQYLDDAEYHLKVAAGHFPESAYHSAAMEGLKETRRRLAEREFYVGRFYFRTGEYKAAIPRFLAVVEKYPETERVPEALYKLVVASGKLKEVEEAKVYFVKLEAEFPKNRWTAKADDKMRALTKKKDVEKKGGQHGHGSQ